MVLEHKTLTLVIVRGAQPFLDGVTAVRHDEGSGVGGFDGESLWLQILP